MTKNKPISGLPTILHTTSIGKVDMPSHTRPSGNIFGHSGKALLAVVLLTSFAGGASADVMYPEEAKAHERLARSKTLVDRVDQYCAGRAVGQQCVIPGSPVAGGGNGTCERRVVRGSSYIDLTCTVSEQPAINRAIPEGPFRAPDELCLTTQKSTPQWVCDTPPRVSDRFCQGREAGQSCEVEFRLAGVPSREAGTCQASVQTRTVYRYGHLTRPILTCEATAEAPSREWTPVSPWKKLWPW